MTTMTMSRIMLTFPASEVTGDKYPITAMVVIIMKKASKNST